MPNGRLSFNLDNLERNVNTCNPVALEFAANVGADLEMMSAEDLSRFRVLISRYREDCTCVRIPRVTKERAREAVSRISKELKELEKTAEERVVPTVEKIRVKAKPIYEKIKERVSPTIEELKIKTTPTIEKIRGRLPY